jgi:catechol 2,3-dioxygenase-like lactoylglutathione lyase family enzyme
MITHLKFASIPCRDQDKALAFWTGKVGFHVLTDQPMGDQRWIELGIPQQRRRGSCCSPRRAMPSA